MAQAATAPLPTATTARYGQFLETQWIGNGWNYSMPSRQYQEIAANSFNNIRLQLTLATAVAQTTNTSTKQMVTTAVKNALLEVPKKSSPYIWQDGRKISTRSFDDAIGFYLALEILRQQPELFSANERAQMIANIRTWLPWVLRAPDTENRALLGAAYGEAILTHPLITFDEQERAALATLLWQKIQVGLQSVDDRGIYREGAPPKFSLHYHLVTTGMLYFLAAQLDDPALRATADKMTAYVHRGFPLGKITWRGSARPTGIGLQTIYLRAFVEKMAGNKKWSAYWEKESRGRGFIDLTAPNRLVWHDDVDKTLNDDYSFVSITALLKNF